MTEQFDPYRKWLGIPPKDQPPTHYRLLGISDQEDDPDVIESAADRQMAHVRTFQTGKRGALSQQLLNELAVAKGCLLDEAKRAAYDRQLYEAADDQAISQADEPHISPTEQEIAPEETSVPSGQQHSGQPGQPRLPTRFIPPAPLRTGRIVPPPAPGLEDEGDSSASEAPRAEEAEDAESSDDIPIGRAVDSDQSYDEPDSEDLATDQDDSEESPTLNAPIHLNQGARRPASARQFARRKKAASWNVIAGVGGGLILLLIIIGVASQSKPGSDKNNNRRPEGEEERNDAYRPGPVQPAPSPGTSSEQSGTEDSLTPFEQALAEARQALASRDLSRAEEQLDLAASFASRAREHSQVNHLGVLAGYLEQFWASVRVGIEDELARQHSDNQPREESVLPYSVISLNEEEVVLRSERRQDTYRVIELPQDIAIDFAKIGAGPSVNHYLYQACFLALDGEAPERVEERLASARGLWRQARDRGVVSRHLAKELQLESEIGASPEVDPDWLAGEEDQEETTDHPAESGSSRRPIPNRTELLEAISWVETQYPNAAQLTLSAEQQFVLAKDLAIAIYQQEDNAVRYAMLTRCRDLAAQLKNLEAVLVILEEMGAMFEIDLTRERVETLSQISIDCEATHIRIEIAQLATTWYDQAIEQRRYEEAEQYLDLLLPACRLANLLRVLREAEQESDRIQDLLNQQELADFAEEKLEASPQDPGGHFGVGWFLCFYQLQWAEGLHHLAQGSDADLADLAWRDLSEPTDPQEMLQLARSWEALGNRKRGIVRHAMWLRAQSWFQHAEGRFDAEGNTQVLDRLAELAEKIDLDSAGQPIAPRMGALFEGSPSGE